VTVREWPLLPVSSVVAQGAKTFGAAAEPLRARNRRQHAIGFGKKILARVIEIVRVLVVTEPARHRTSPIASGLSAGPDNFSSFTCGN